MAVPARNVFSSLAMEMTPLFTATITTTLPLPEPFVKRMTLLYH